MLRDLRLKIRNRRSNICSCSSSEFLPLSKQFFAFLNGSSLLNSVIAEILARHPKAVEDATSAEPSAQVYGTTAEEAAVIAFTKWKRYSEQDRPEDFIQHIPGVARLDDALSRYRDWYVEPLLEYMDEILEDSNVILGTLTRYKCKVEWYAHINKSASNRAASGFRPAKPGAYIARRNQRWGGACGV
jgi:hypothetical protein